MKKRIISVLLAFVLLCTLLPQAALPAIAAGENTCGANLTWSFDESTKTLTIAGTGDMEDYGYDFNYPWKQISDDILKLVLPEGLTRIGNCAFYRCDNLASVTLPQSLKTIGWSAFQGTSLTAVTIPAGVTTLGESAFLRTPLTAVTIPGSVDIIERIRRKKFSSDGMEFGITMTIGICLGTPGDNVDKIITKADERLYKGKHSGKNHTEFE